MCIGEKELSIFIEEKIIELIQKNNIEGYAGITIATV